MGRPATGHATNQSIRIPDDDWHDFNAATGGKGAEVIRAFIRFYLRRRGAKAVKRPQQEPATRRTDPMLIVNQHIGAVLEEFGSVAGRDFLVSQPLPAELGEQEALPRGTDPEG